MSYGEIMFLKRVNGKSQIRFWSVNYCQKGRRAYEETILYLITRMNFHQGIENTSNC